MPDPLYGHTANDGFHRLKDCWCQKAYLSEQSGHLADNLEVAIRATVAAAPERTLSFALGRGATVNIDETERERRWERSVFQRWRVSGLSPVEQCWTQLVAFQVPLFAEKEKDGWGYVDLLGVLKDGTISVVELKKEPRTKPSGGTDSSESPLRMVLESAAYALALQKNWTHFRRELTEHLDGMDVDPAVKQRIPDRLDRIRLVGAAPAAYWIDWLPVTPKGQTISQEAWCEFRRLLKGLEASGLPVSFLSISGDIGIPGSLAAQPLTGFPVMS